MNKLILIILREFITKVRSKTFIILTFLSPFAAVLIALVINILISVNNGQIKEVAYVDESGLITENGFGRSDLANFIDLTKLGADEAKAQFKKGHYFGYIHIPKTDSLETLSKQVSFYAHESPNILIIKYIEGTIAHKLKLEKYKQLNVDMKNIEAANIAVSLNILNTSEVESSQLIHSVKVALGLISGYMIMIFIIIYGSYVMRSTMEEKSSRIIEIVISSVKPFQLMLGKIIGNVMAGLFQFFSWGVLAFVFVSIISSFYDLDVFNMGTNIRQGVASTQILQNKEILLLLKESQSLPLISMVVFFILYFLGGYFLYSAIYAAIGAAVNQEADTQQFMFPVILPLLLSVYIGFTSVAGDPNGPISFWFSMFPLTSPIVMMMRFPFDVPWWQLATSLFILLVSFLLAVWFAGKVYRIGVVSYGKRPTYKDLYRWMRY